LKETSTQELKTMWKELYGNEPPPYSRQHLMPRLAYRIQELAHGGLTKETQQRVKQLIENADVKKPRVNSERLTAGTVLVREWRGVEHRITVLHDGYDYMGRRYKSLSAIARAITGTNWNGPAFFGLRRHKVAA
jgi:hypothetical protein